jgi:cytochrome c oxidase subunit 2
MLKIFFIVSFYLIPFVTTCDCPQPWQIGFQDPASPIIIGIIKFHNHLIILLTGICIFVFWILSRALLRFIDNPNLVKFTHSTTLEITWTIVPALLLLYIAGPSFSLLYSIDELIQADITLKVIGHQWYWSYEYNSFILEKTRKGFKFDAYIISEDDITLGGLRLLEVDYRTKLPINKNIKILVTSADVLHSWAVPSLGIKIDACPGRLNQVFLYLLRTGVFYGQCSEICGVNHGFIPIVVEGVKDNDFIQWVYKNLISQ